MDLTPVYLIVWAAFLLMFGYFAPLLPSKATARGLAWSLIVSTTFFSVWASAGETPLFRMLAIVSLQLLAMKSIVMVETFGVRPKNAFQLPLSFAQWLAFAAGWFGMRPVQFASLGSGRLLGVAPLIWKGISRMALGLLLLYISKWVEGQAWGIYFLPDLLLLVGLSLILHFGILNLSTAFWRFFGVDVKELFISPYLSLSLKEFWGRRWNMAFSEMAAVVAYKPLKQPLGKNTALLSSFLLSGLLHEIAISCPVNAGYGLPMLYFVMHGLAMHAEAEWGWVRHSLNRPWRARLWVFGWLVLPMPLLFHHDFMAFVLRPLRDLLLVPFI